MPKSFTNSRILQSYVTSFANVTFEWLLILIIFHIFLKEEISLHGLFHITTSAKTSENVETAFKTLASHIIENMSMRNHGGRDQQREGDPEGSRPIKLHEPPRNEDNVADEEEEIKGSELCGMRRFFKKFWRADKQKKNM